MTPLTASETEMRAGEAAAPPDPIERSEYTAQVFAALGTLPENQQEVIRLKFQHGLSYKEISRVTQLTVTNVGFLIHTALKTIRQRMKDSEDEDEVTGTTWQAARGK